MEIKNENIIEKLEQIKPRAIEIASHKENLKKALIDWKYGEKQKQSILSPFSTFKNLTLTLSGATIVLLLLFAVNTLFQPQLTLAEAREIALKDFSVQKLISEGNQIQDIKIVNEKAFVLITAIEKETTSEPKAVATSSVASTSANSNTPILVQVSFKEKRVTRIKNAIVSEKLLTAEKETEATSILISSKASESSATTSKIQIESVATSPASTSKLKLTPKNGGVEVSPQEEKVMIIYKVDNLQKESEVNITSQQVESTQTLSSDK